MSRSAKVTLVFGDGKHDFALTIGGAEELQEKVDAGPEEHLRALAYGTWKTPAWITEPLRIGLVGAGMKATEALVLVERYCGPGNLLDWKEHAQAVLMAFLTGAPDEDDELGEPKGAAKTRRSPGVKSGSGGSTRSAASSASRRTKSPKAASGG